MRAWSALASKASIHDSLTAGERAEPGSVRAKVLVCHGALDPHVPLVDVTAFADEMNDAGADWQLIMYGGALHGFTHEGTALGAIPGVAYDPRADARSFAAARSFLAGLFADGA
jgi:dienelactone hydrolase